MPPAGDIPIGRTPPGAVLFMARRRLLDQPASEPGGLEGSRQSGNELGGIAARRGVRSKVDHVDAAPGDSNDQALVSQDPEGFLGGALGNPILLGDALDRRHRLTRRDLTGSDHLAQDSGELQVGGLPGEMINGHLARVGIPWWT